MGSTPPFYGGSPYFKIMKKRKPKSKGNGSADPMVVPLI